MLQQTDPIPSSNRAPADMTNEPESVACPACGADNPAEHKFCGSCGAHLDNTVPTSRPVSEDSPELPAQRDDRQQAFEDSITNPHELSLFRSFRPSDSADEWDDEPSTPYRLYVGLLLVIIIAGLGYIAWRKSQANGASNHGSLPAPVASEAPAPAPRTPAPATPETRSAGPNNPPAPAAKTETPTAKQATARRPKPSTPTPKVPDHVAATPRVDNGSEELATAERYLNGGTGQGRNTSEAARWLWKSIAKHNSQATVLLADLYLRGDGVSKNCDQARVLLDSAARKGVSGAGARLRNLQAFGCQ